MKLTDAERREVLAAGDSKARIAAFRRIRQAHRHPAKEWLEDEEAFWNAVTFDLDRPAMKEGPR